MSYADCSDKEYELRDNLDNFCCNISAAYQSKDWDLLKTSYATMQWDLVRKGFRPYEGICNINKILPHEDWMDDAKELPPQTEYTARQKALRSIIDHLMMRVGEASYEKNWKTILRAYEIMQLERQCNGFRRFCGGPNLEDLFPNKSWVCNPEFQAVED